MGLSQPVHVLQRGAEVNDIVNVAAIAVVDAQDAVGARRNAHKLDPAVPMSDNIGSTVLISNMRRGLTLFVLLCLLAPCTFAVSSAKKHKAHQPPNPRQSRGPKATAARRRR